MKNDQLQMFASSETRVSISSRFLLFWSQDSNRNPSAMIAIDTRYTHNVCRIVRARERNTHKKCRGNFFAVSSHDIFLSHPNVVQETRSSIATECSTRIILYRSIDEKHRLIEIALVSRGQMRSNSGRKEIGDSL